MIPLCYAALGLAATTGPTLAANLAGTFGDGGSTQVSAMMVFLGNNEKVYVLDKAQGNAAQIDGHPAWGAVWDVNTHKVDLMKLRTNTFCASGLHLPNGSYVTFGGNGAIGPGPSPSQQDPYGNGLYDATYGDYDGTKAIRLLDPCTSADDMSSEKCQWLDNPEVLSMQKKRWYSTAEAAADGSIVIIGGFVNGGYINRNYPNNDAECKGGDAGGAAECTYETYPANGRVPVKMDFMVKTGGLNSYSHAFTMPSGKMFVQANYSTTLWDWKANTEEALPDMPQRIIRTYPASGATAMLPLTPANNYEPTILFCGGTNLNSQTDEVWGNYSWPFVNTWEIDASKDCQRITPEPQDGTAPIYVQDDDMSIGRTMGQFITMPDGKMLVVNGGAKGTAGYSTMTLLTPESAMPWGQSLAAEQVGQPGIYDPTAPAGKRWSSAGLDTSKIARLYHSSALLLPDASILIAGSSPNIDVDLEAFYPTTYQAEIFYPPYFAATTRPLPSGVPKTLSYGGLSFDLTIPAASYSGSANDAGAASHVSLVRGGWSTHGMNMGQRYLQLRNSFTVNKDGSLTLHVAQVPNNPNLLTPGPVLLFVVVNGIPSNGTMVIVGTGNIEEQPTSADSVLPESVLLSSVSGTADGASTSVGTNGNGTKGNSKADSDSSGLSTPMLIGAIVGGIALLGILGAIIGVCLSRRRRENAPAAVGEKYAMSDTSGSNHNHTGYAAGQGAPTRGYEPTPSAPDANYAGQGGYARGSDSSAFAPLHQSDPSGAWGHGSEADLRSPQPYRDDNDAGSRASSAGDYEGYYSNPPQNGHGAPPQNYGRY